MQHNTTDEITPSYCGITLFKVVLINLPFLGNWIFIEVVSYNMYVIFIWKISKYNVIIFNSNTNSLQNIENSLVTLLIQHLLENFITNFLQQGY